MTVEQKVAADLLRSTRRLTRLLDPELAKLLAPNPELDHRLENLLARIQEFREAREGPLPPLSQRHRLG